MVFVKIVVKRNKILNKYMEIKMKKLISICLTAILCFSLAACAKDEPKENISSDAKQEIKIVTTTFPAYDWAREISKGVDDVSVLLLNDTGADLHSYQATTDDVMNILSSDIFVYVGGQSDKWAMDAVSSLENGDIAVINLLEVLGDRAQFLKENEEMAHNHSHTDKGKYPDEHVWLSLKNAEIFCEKIENALETKDEKNKPIYEENLKAFLAQLDTLDKEYEKASSNSEKKSLVFGDRFPFLYLTKDYDLSYYAAFLGCSAESEASFDIITYLSKKLDDLSLNSILTIEKSDKKIAETIRENTKTKDAEILTLNSMQSVSREEIEAGATYISIMKENLETLKKAL